MGLNKTMNRAIVNKKDEFYTSYATIEKELPLMLNSGAKVLVLGNNNAITYSDIFPFIRDGELWLGVNSNKTEEFMLHHTYDKFSREDELGNKFGKVPAISWFTNLTPDTPKETVNKMSLKEFVESEYRSYDNYDAIEVDKVENIPHYEGVMGVPITYLSVHCPDTFKIVGSNRGRGQCKDGVYGRSSYIDGKETFKRLFIQLIGD